MYMTWYWQVLLVSDILIFYGSRARFNELLPKEYKTLTELVYESAKDSKNIVMYVAGHEPPDSERIKVDNFVVGSDEYSGVREHVIINFNNFLSMYAYKKLYLHNPPLQISNQIIRLFPDTKVINQKYVKLNLRHLKKINVEYDQNIIGQERAKAELLQSLYPVTLSNVQKPIVILLYGNSGVGKTETAKFISQIVKEPLFRKQFSMYQNNQFSNYLFGGAHSEKSFAKDLLDRESNVILLDEFDKAHPSFYSAFYQLFDEGIYEDQNYRIVLKKSVIICTSNYLTPKEIEKKLGSPIYYRFDKIIHFNDLSTESKQKIGDRLYKSMSKEFKIDLRAEIEEKLVASFKKCNNVRSIKNLIQDTFAYYAIVSKLVDNNIKPTTE